MNQIISVSSKDTQNFHKNTSDSGALLGILRIYEPTSNHAAFSSPLNHPKIKHSPDGVVQHTPDSQENRIIRFQRQSAARRLLKDKRVCGCLRNRMAKSVKILNLLHMKNVILVILWFVALYGIVLYVLQK